jgi:GDP-4-dehydro-6-deoxy-D-mannose reductase
VKTLITGAAGFVGSHLVELLLSRGAEVYAVVEAWDQRASLPALPGVSVVEADIRQGESVHKLVRDFAPDQIYHLAAISAVARSLQDPLLTYETNALGTWNVLEAARRATKPPRVLCTSTAQVYDATARFGPLAETTPLRPLTPYSASKLCAEIVAFQYHASWGLPAIVVRPFNCIGPGQAPEFVCSDFARQMAEIALGIRPPVVRVGDLSRERDFTDVRDAVRAFVLALEHGAPGEAYNVCSGALHSIREVVDDLAEIAQLNVAVETEAARKRAVDPSAMVGDWSKLRQQTGWRPEIAFRRSLADGFEYWRARLAVQRGQGAP